MRKEKPLVEIRTSALVEGINELDFTCKAGDFEGRQLTDAGLAGEVRVHVTARKSDEEITVTIRTSAEVDVTCDRCLAPVSRMLSGTLDLFYTFSTPLDGQYENIDEYRQIAKSTEYIDITADVCDALILSLPVKVTCTDNPECRLYGCDEGDCTAGGGAEREPEERSAWQESLEKLKNKYS
jgi:uncharacterized protein